MTYNGQRALELLRLGSSVAGSGSGGDGGGTRFREGQEEAIRHIVEGRCRLLVVQTTGWGQVARGVRAGPVLLVDDMVDSRWTLTVAAWLLRFHGSGEVLPLALALAGHDK